VESDKGIELKEEYRIGTTYPVFLLMKDGEEIVKRWTGYSTASAFISTLKAALSDLSSIDERLARFKASPSFDDARALAKYYADAFEYIRAIEFYRYADSLCGRPGTFDYDIFMNTANAVWNDKMPFDSLMPVADKVIEAKRRNTAHITKVAEITARVARKAGRTGDISKYLEAAIDATAGNPKHSESHQLILAEYALYVDLDTTEALRIKKASMGDGWENERDKFFAFAKWCLERKINLEEAEMYARRTINLVYPGRIRAMVLSKTAEICEARGKISEAIGLVEMAIEQEPDNRFYPNQLEKLRQTIIE
jgi:hypothetical protein